jgi:hypothetical protein
MASTTFSRLCAGRYAIAVRDDARDDGYTIAIRFLPESASACGQVIDNFWGMQMQF